MSTAPVGKLELKLYGIQMITIKLLSRVKFYNNNLTVGIAEKISVFDKRLTDIGRLPI